MNTKNAFTLIELAVVAIIIGILVLVGIPNMLKGVNRGYAQDAMRNLMAIYAAQQNFYQNNSNVYFTCASADACNAGLGLNIVKNGGTDYSCDPAVGKCTARNPGATGTMFTMEVDLNSSVAVNTSPMYCVVSGQNPCCTGGAAGWTYCPRV